MLIWKNNSNGKLNCTCGISKLTNSILPLFSKLMLLKGIKTICQIMIIIIDGIFPQVELSHGYEQSIKSFEICVIFQRKLFRLTEQQNHWVQTLNYGFYLQLVQKRVHHLSLYMFNLEILSAHKLNKEETGTHNKLEKEWKFMIKNTG